MWHGWTQGYVRVSGAPAPRLSGLPVSEGRTLHQLQKTRDFLDDDNSRSLDPGSGGSMIVFNVRPAVTRALSEGFALEEDRRMQS